MWLCIHLTQPALDALLRSGLDQRCIAVVEAHGSQREIHRCDPVAAAAGVRPGMKLNAAYALAPELAVFPRNRSAEKRALHQVALAAYRFSSRVSIRPPDCVIAEIGRSRRLLRRQRLHEFLAPLEYQTRHAGAPTPEAARLLAHAGRYRQTRTLDDIDDIPLRFTGLERSVVEGLQGVGIQTVADLKALPRDGLSRRFGRATLDYLDRLTGRRADPLPWFEPPTAFDSTLELPRETEDAQALVFAASRLLGELQVFLEARELAAQQLLFRLDHAHGAHTVLKLGLRQPEWRARRLTDLFRERMTHETLAAPVRSLSLRVPDPCRAIPRNRDLFEDGSRHDEHEWSRLLERLRSRLGEDAVLNLELVADYRPERSWQAHPGRRNPDPELRPLPPRPLWLLHEPQPLDLDAVRLLDGPERIESGWWDDADVARDYYVAEDSGGLRLWVFQECRNRDRWFVHGLFG